MIKSIKPRHSEQGAITNIKDCLSSDLAGLEVYAGSALLASLWPQDNQIFSEELIQTIAPIVVVEEQDILNQDLQRVGLTNIKSGSRTFIPVCKNRECIVMFLNKGKEIDFRKYVVNPKKIYHWTIPSVPVCHVPMAGFDLAISEALQEHTDITWQRTAEGGYKRSVVCLEASVSWLRTSEDIYDHVVVPYLHMLEILHAQHTTHHGDITDDNTLMSEKLRQLFFIDFETLGSTKYVADIAENKRGYYLWHMERLYDLASLAYTIVNLTHRYLPSIEKTDCIIQYFSRLGKELDEVADQHQEYEDYLGQFIDSFELDEACIQRHMHRTITSIKADIQQLHAVRIAAPASSRAVSEAKEDNTPEPHLAKSTLARRFSMFGANDGTEIELDHQDKRTKLRVNHDEVIPSIVTEAKSIGLGN